MEKHGLVLVHTGDGKGKTTAALGLAIRSWGDGFRVKIIQFIKGGWKTGEMKTIEELGKLSDGRISLEQCGLGFTNTDKVTMEEHKAAAHEAYDKAKAIIEAEGCDLLVLDEINCAVHYNLITEEELFALLDLRPREMHIVCTGRDAAPALMERADLVTEMKLIKHPYDKGIPAQLGVEF